MGGGGWGWRGRMHGCIKVYECKKQLHDAQIPNCKLILNWGKLVNYSAKVESPCPLHTYTPTNSLVCTDTQKQVTK